MVTYERVQDILARHGVNAVLRVVTNPGTFDRTDGSIIGRVTEDIAVRSTAPFNIRMRWDQTTPRRTARVTIQSIREPQVGWSLIHSGIDWKINGVEPHVYNDVAIAYSLDLEGIGV